MRLADASAVLTTMGIVENTGSLANASKSLELSYPILENLLETTFAEQHVADYFDTTSGELTFRLKNMFVDPYTLKVRRSVTGDPLILPTDGELVDPSEYMLDPEKGYITFRKEERKGKCMLSAVYDSGLPVSDGDEEVLEAPQWLQECSVSVAVHAQNVLVSSPANRKDKTVINISAEIRHLASQLLNSRKRLRMTVVFPTVSVVDD